MTKTNPRRIATLAVGVAIGAVVMLLVVLAAGSLTVSQFVALQRFLIVALNLVFLVWAVLYAPLRARGLDKRIRRLESIVSQPPPRGDSGKKPCQTE